MLYRESMSETAFGYTVETGTDAELLVLYRACLAALSVNQSYAIRGRSFTKADLSEVRDTITWLEKRVSAASGGIAYNVAAFKRAV